MLFPFCALGLILLARNESSNCVTKSRLELFDDETAPILINDSSSINMEVILQKTTLYHRNFKNNPTNIYKPRKNPKFQFFELS